MESPNTALSILIQLFKTLEHKSLFFFRDTASGIRYRENSHLLFLIHRKVQGNLPAFRKFVGVGQQINENLVQAQGIPVKLLVDNPAGTDSKSRPPCALGLNYFGNLLRQTWKGYPHAVENQPGALNFTHIQHIVYQAHEMPGGQ